MIGSNDVLITNKIISGEVLSTCHIILLAMKPQFLDSAIQNLQAHNKSSGLDRLFISILAGITIDSLIQVFLIQIFIFISISYIVLRKISFDYLLVILVSPNFLHLCVTIVKCKLNVALQMYGVTYRETDKTECCIASFIMLLSHLYTICTVVYIWELGECTHNDVKRIEKLMYQTFCWQYV